MLATMVQPSTARARALDSFARILVSSGERAATLEAVAESAGISKGGLLYHFGSKVALVTGLTDLLRELITGDLAAMSADPDGATAYLLRTSAQFDTEFEGVYIAVVTLAQSGHSEAVAVLAEADEAWTGAVTEELGDPAVARAVTLISDGIYAHAAITGAATGHDVGELRELIAQLVAARH